MDSYEAYLGLEIEEEDGNEDEYGEKENYYSQWGRRIFESVLVYINESEDRINGLYLHNLKFAEYLMEDLVLFPLW